MRTIRYLLHVLLFMLFILPDVASQGNMNVVNETYDDKTDQLFRYYSQSVEKSKLVLNGKEYTGFDRQTQGHQFYQTEEFTLGSVTYDGNRYDSLLIAYDTFNDELCLAYITGTGIYATIQLDKRSVDAFHIFGQSFIRLTSARGIQDVSSEGYYQVLYDGSITLLARRQKEKIPATGTAYLYQFSEDDKLYLIHQNRINRIRSRGSFYRVLNAYKKELKRFARSGSIPYYRNSDQYFSALCAHYDRTLKGRVE